MKETTPPGKGFRCHFVLFLIECVLYEKPKAASVDEGMQCTAERWGLLQGPAENTRSVGMVEATCRELTGVLRLQGQSH